MRIAALGFLACTLCQAASAGPANSYQQTIEIDDFTSVIHGENLHYTNAFTHSSVESVNAGKFLIQLDSTATGTQTVLNTAYWFEDMTFDLADRSVESIDFSLTFNGVQDTGIRDGDVTVFEIVPQFLIEQGGIYQFLVHPDYQRGSSWTNTNTPEFYQHLNVPVADLPGLDFSAGAAPISAGIFLPFGVSGSNATTSAQVDIEIIDYSVSIRGQIADAIPSPPLAGLLALTLSLITPLLRSQRNS